MKAFKSHKINGIDKNICNAEQKIAYNYLFAYAKTATKNKALDIIQKSLAAGQSVDPKKYDIDLIYHYVLQSIDRYQNYNNSGILTSYAEIGKVIFSEIKA